LNLESNKAMMRRSAKSLRHPSATRILGDMAALLTLCDGLVSDGKKAPRREENAVRGEEDLLNAKNHCLQSHEDAFLL